MDPLRNRIQRYVARLIRWAMVVEDGGDENPYPTQTLSYLGKEGESMTWFPYGFTALAPRDALTVMLAQSGDAASRVHLPGSPKERPKMKRGEVAMYHPATGAIVHMKEDGSIHLIGGQGGELHIQEDGSVDVLSDVNILFDSGGTFNIVSTGAAAISVAGLTVQGNTAFQNNLTAQGDLSHTGTNLGFFSTAAIPIPTVSGDRQGGSALNSLLDALDALGIINDTS